MATPDGVLNRRPAMSIAESSSLTLANRSPAAVPMTSAGSSA